MITSQNMTVVSVVIPTYNREEVVDRAIDSALNQTQQNIEIIVVDDASTDNTREVVTSYDDSRLVYIRHEKNKGGSAARNTGIKRANGKYIAFLDSDDEWDKDKLKIQINCLKNRNEKWGAIYCGFRTKRNNPLTTFVDSQFHGNTGQEGNSEIIKDLLLLQFSNGGASTLVVRRDLVEKIDGFDESFSRHQDWEFLIRLLRSTKLAYVDEKLVTKHHTGGVRYETAVQAKKQYLQKFAPEVVELAWKGYPVIERHRFMIAKVAFENNKMRCGFSFLRKSSIPSFRDGLGLIKSVYSGYVNG
jgi:glycosyltransferase involved in cell wall biosynthesis